jgi:hypothetical protein
MAYSWMMLYYYVLTDTLCADSESDHDFFGILKLSIKTLFNRDTFPSRRFLNFDAANETSITFPTFNMTKNKFSKFKVDIPELLYDNATFYTILSIIAIYFFVEFVILVYKDLVRTFSSSKRISLFQIEQTKETGFLDMNLDVEIKYVKDLATPKPKNVAISYFRAKFESNIYQSRAYYRFSKQFISTQFIGFMIIFFLTTTIIRNVTKIIDVIYGTIVLIIDYLVTDVFSELFTNTKTEEQDNYIQRLDQNGTLIKSIKNSHYIEKMLNDRKEITSIDPFEIGESIVVQACLITSFIFTIQILLFVKRYQKHVLNAYKGVYIDIPSPAKFKNSKLVSGSMRYR